MAFEYYLSLPGIRDAGRTMRSVHAQLEPYRQYLERAEKAAHEAALSLGWRKPTAEERRELDERMKQQFQRTPSAEPGKRRRDRQIQSTPPTGHWVMLESLSSDQKDESIFSAFLEAKEIYDRAPERTYWFVEARISVAARDYEAQALLLSDLPRPMKVKTGEDEEDQADELVLFLRPNTYSLQRQKRAVAELKDCPHVQRGPLVRLATPNSRWLGFQPEPVGEWVLLTDTTRSGTHEQRRFVEVALGTPDFALLQGPPGSGKTTAICELICQLARQGKRILLVASTHVAVDNVLEKLAEWQDGSNEKLVMPIRIGDDDRVSSEAVRPWILKRVVSSWRGEVLDFLDAPSGVTESGVAARGTLQGSLKAGQEGFQRLILEVSNLVCGTTIGILQHPAIKNGDVLAPFDVMILDEASKTTFAEFLVPALHANRWIIVGDRRQLSPYVEEQDLRTNLRALRSTVSADALLCSFLASRRKPECSLVAVENAAEAAMIAAEVGARGLVAVDLDKPETHAWIPGASIIYGRPETMEAMQHRMPGDFKHVFGCGDLSLGDWKAHRDAQKGQDTLTWEGEVAWRLIRAHELRDNPEEAAPYKTDLKALQPVAGNEQSMFTRQLDTLQRVALPSILEILQHGAGSMGWNQETVLTDGLPQPDLERRLVSLSFQHRMHPDISAFPREQFYADDDLLHDATGMAAQREWDYSRYARRAVWFDVARRWSKGNACVEEADVAIQELKAFAAWAEHAPKPGADPLLPWEVAVLTFYRPQERELRARLRKLCGQYGRTSSFEFGKRVRIKLATVDRFQGQEADFVLLSFVKSGSAGFLNSPNRLNVALTRARFQMVLIGHRSWMGSDRCRSDLLKSLATSTHYKQAIVWGANQ
ncbi:DEAD/DEAH box helicase [Nitrospirillum sp. BR 11828]|uniref:DEAD/DEAH box helicase n=1 Tax=Nitrospirillum sp. BR 11828 TaxID=3104325 RepID=UPI002ACA0A74|nr:DEAD/DEAH box helicase [Nitrospirillum sp. BR 11828]MDZ5649429.1 DEAD/DEAH box helicase [Nitrospirillum sp. BR 11828]